MQKSLSPFKYIQYRETNENLSTLINRVYGLAKAESTHGTFGLTLLDLWKMDFASFVDLEARVRELDKAKADIVDDELKEIQDIKKE